MTCPKCGEALEVGSWPFCAGGHGKGVNAVIQDTIPGGFAQENFGHEVEHFTSKRAMAARQKQLGLQSRS